MKSQHDGHLLAPASPNIKSKKKQERNSEPPQCVEKRGLNSRLYTQRLTAGEIKSDRQNSKRVLTSFFPNHFFLTSLENMRSRKDV